jgi:type I restriction enzyme, R subunit
MLILDEKVIDEILSDSEQEKKSLIGRDIPYRPPSETCKNQTFTALGDRLEMIRERHEQGFLTSLEFLKVILEVARDVVEAERNIDPKEERDRVKEALTELFNEAKNKSTHIIVERIVADID